MFELLKTENFFDVEGNQIILELTIRVYGRIDLICEV